MCGRIRCSLSREEVRAEARVARWRDEDAFQPTWNGSPGRGTPVLKQAEAGQQELHTMTWGLVPSYTKADDKPDFFRMFNARSETVASKGVFKKLLSRQRCVVLLNGFYEWKQEGKAKQPFFVHQAGRAAMRVAGLWDAWQRGEGQPPLHSFTVLTTDASARLQWLHDRQPVILPDRAAEELWLSARADEQLQELSALYEPYNGEDLAWHAVDPAMSSQRRDGPECCQPLKRTPITSFFKPKPERAAKPAASVKPDPAAGAAVKPEPSPAAAEAESSAAAATGARAEPAGQAGALLAEAPDGSAVRLEEVNDGNFEGAGGQPRLPAAPPPQGASGRAAAAGSPSTPRKRGAEGPAPGSGGRKAAKQSPASAPLSAKITAFFKKS